MRGLFTNLQLRWRALWKRQQLESDLEDELAFHLAMREQKNREAGVGESARRSFGNPALVKEDLRDQWTFRAVENLWRDLRYAARMLWRSPGFTLVATLSLAIGIGANMALFGLIDALMLRSLPVARPDELVAVVDERNGDFTDALWEQLRDRQRVFAGVFAWANNGFDLAAGGEKQPVDGLYVSGDYFRTLGVLAQRGRVLMADDDRRGGPDVAVISDAFWRRQYGADPQAVGRTIRLDGHAFTIVGITPPGFSGMNVGSRFDVAVPLASEAVVDGESSALTNRMYTWLSVIGRLKPIITRQKAGAGLDVVSPAIFAAAVPPDLRPEDRRSFLRGHFTLRGAATGLSELRERYSRGLVILLSIVGVVLLIACINLANLLMARANARRREVAVRLALGAGRVRLVRQFLTESLLLAVLGALLGVLLAQWGGRSLTGFLNLFLDLSPDLRVLGFTAALTIVTSLLFGLAPALQATRSGPNNALKEGTRSVAGSSSRRGLGRLLVAGQIALSLLLVAGAGLLVRTLHALLTEDMGFERKGVLMVNVDLRHTAYADERQSIVAGELLARFQAIPGVRFASRSAVTPIDGTSWQWDVRVDSPGGQQRKEHAYFNLVSPGFFETMRTPRLAGRNFTGQDTATSPRVAIVNEALARKFFPGANPIGKVYRDDAPPGTPAKEFITEIVGVVKDAKYRRVRDDVPPTIYIPITQNPAPFPVVGTYALRFSSSVRDVTASVREAAHDFNPRISLDIRLLSTQVEDSLLQERLVALLSAAFGLLALVLAAAGLYGVVAYSVTRRFHEIGIRMALGAGRGSVEWMVLREVGTLLIAGLTSGLAMALVGARLMRTMLYGLSQNDPITLTGSCVLLLIVGALAGWIPARRAARIDPMRALRCE